MIDDRTNVYIGIDAGASKTAVLCSRDGNLFDFVHPQGINYQRVGADDTVRRLSAAVGKCFDETGSVLAEVDRVNICVGIAGADTIQDRELLKDGLVKNLAAKPEINQTRVDVTIVQDSVVALHAAFGNDSGVVIIIGTGSVVIARDDTGNYHRTGGWGYLLGDEGSANEIGTAALTRLSHQMDTGSFSKMMSDVMTQAQIDSRADLIRRAYQEPEFIQSIAPIVLEWFDKGDHVARDIVNDGAAGVARCFERLIDKVPEGIRKQYVLFGGLSRSASYRNQVAEAVAAVSADWKLVEPLHKKPVAGALMMARNAN